MSSADSARDRIDTIEVLLNCFKRKRRNDIDNEKIRHIKLHINRIMAGIHKLKTIDAIVALNQCYSSTTGHANELAEVECILKLFSRDLISSSIDKKKRKLCLSIINNILKELRKLSITIQTDDDKLQMKNILFVDVKKSIPIDGRNVIIDSLVITNKPHLSIQQRPTTYLHDDVWIYHNSTESSVSVSIRCIPSDMEFLTVTCTDINDDEKKHDITLTRNEQMCYVLDSIIFNLKNDCFVDCGFRLSISGVSIGKVVFRCVSRGCFYTKRVVK